MGSVEPWEAWETPGGELVDPRAGSSAMDLETSRGTDRTDQLDPTLLQIRRARLEALKAENKRLRAYLERFGHDPDRRLEVE